MAEQPEEKRDALHAAIQQAGPEFDSGHAVLTGWAMVAEWMDEQGERWLSRAHAAGMTSWAVKSLHHEALYGEWP